MTPEETKIADALFARVVFLATPESRDAALETAVTTYLHFIQACEARERLAARADSSPVYSGDHRARLGLSDNPNHQYTCRDCGRILPSTAQAMIREFGGTLSCSECTAAGKRILAK